MKLSIIIPALNEEKLIVQTIEFLFKNSDSRLAEIIVVDGKSDDQTAEFSEKAGAKILMLPVRNRAAQMNFGAQKAVGNVLYFVHADTHPPISFMDDIEKSIREGVKMGCFRYRFDSKKWLLKFNAWWTRFPMSWCQGGDKTFFIEKTAFLELGGYDEKMVVMEEYEFFQRARKRLGSLKIVAKNALVSARKYERNSWLRVNLANLLMFNLWRLGVQPTSLKQLYVKILRN